MIRLLMVINRYHPYIGGNEIQCKLLSEELVSYGATVSVVTTWQKGARLHETVNGVNVFRILPPVGVRAMLWPTALLANTILFFFLLINRKNYDIIHAHQALWHALGAVTAGKLLKKKSVIKIAGGGPYGNVDFWQRRWLAGSKAIQLITKADVIVSLSEEIVLELSAFGKLNNVITVPNGVKCNAGGGFKKPDEVESAKQRYRKIALFVGRLVEEKGVDILLQAWKTVLNDMPTAGLFIVGEGPEQKKLSDYIEKNNMTESVVFIGQQSKVLPYLTAGDVFILPSRGGEGMSNSLLEAMSCGLPCIASGIGGNAKLIRHMETGLLFDVNEPLSLARHIIEVFRNDRLACALGDQARRFVEAHFSIDAIAKQYLLMYTRLLQEHSDME